jgi:hypothetical protein
VFALYRHVATADEVESLAGRYESGSDGYRDAKEMRLDAHERRFGHSRQRFRELMADRSELRTLLATGAERARDLADKLAQRVEPSGSCDRYHRRTRSDHVDERSRSPVVRDGSGAALFLKVGGVRTSRSARRPLRVIERRPTVVRQWTMCDRSTEACVA